MRAARVSSVLEIALLLAINTVRRATSDRVVDVASSRRSWTSSGVSLADCELTKSHLQARSDVNCVVVADVTTDLVSFDPDSGLCTEYRCRLLEGLSLCRECRILVQQGAFAQRLWTTVPERWTTVQHRVSASVSFKRNWTDYKSGFGEGPHGNYWIGLDALYTLTSAKQRKLLFIMKQWTGVYGWALYSSFSVGPESDFYRLSLYGFSSQGVTDSMAGYSGQQFSTADADHDTWSDNCAVQYNGAWWFASCFRAHLNGEYKNLTEAIGGPFAQGLIWADPYGYYYSLMEVEMLVV